MITLAGAHSQQVQWHKLRWKWVIAGAGLVILHAWLASISSSFNSQRTLAQQPILLLTGIQVLAGLFFLLSIADTRSSGASGKQLCWMLIVGGVMRCSLLSSTPILEDDFYRYLWDGAVTAHGFSPYALSPTQVLNGKVDDRSIPPMYKQLEEQGRSILEKANHPYLRTIYPPVAQGAFALAHWLGPWTLSGWRTVLSAADLLTLGLLALLLKRLKLPLHGLVIYWWNPILIKETYNSLHMDVIVLPFVLGAVLLALWRRYILSVLVLVFAVGAKLWPALLLPALLRPILGEPKKWIPAICLFGIVSGIVFAPVHAAGWNESSGLWKYSQTWEMNDSAFMPLLWLTETVLKQTGILVGRAQLIARLVVAVCLACWIMWLVRKDLSTPLEFFERCLWIVAALFLLSPTQLPWYYLCLLPFLTIRPTFSLLVLTVTLPLYYLRFYFDATHQVEIFDYGIVWFEFAPVWFLLGRDWMISRSQTHRRLPIIEVPA
jgi:hypothetical protein